MMGSTIPITVFTGFLGAGKTTLLLSLLPFLNKEGYKACLLKNEFGDVQVDSQLAKHSSLAGVSEILNGCMCCVLVGQMKTALLEIKDKFKPDRIFIETSGSAFPATLAFQIRELERETSGGFKLDAIVTVIDAENFIGYEDTSPTARMQASYTDLILINKWEHVSERQLDIVLDHLHTLNDLTPKIKCNGKGGIDPDLVFGLDTKLFSDPTQLLQSDGSHNDEVQTLTIWKGISDSSLSQSCSCDTPHEPLHEHNHPDNLTVLTEELLTSALAAMPKESVWRVKGFIRFTIPMKSQSSPLKTSFIVNWAFGRLEMLPRIAAGDDPSKTELHADVLLTVMGERGEVKRLASRLAKALGAQIR